MVTYGAFVSPGSGDEQEVNALLGGTSRDSHVEVNKGTATVRRNIFFAAVLLLAGITSVMYASSHNGVKKTSKLSSGTEVNLDSVPLRGETSSAHFTRETEKVLDGFSNGITISVENEYGTTSREGNILEYPSLKSRTLIEPYKWHTLSVYGLTEQIARKATFKYLVISSNSRTLGEILGEGNLIVSEKGEASVDLYIKSTGSAEFRVEAILPNREKTTYSFSIALKYVRRELTKLTDSDRENFLDAMYTLWSVSTKEGVEKYGPDYKSIFYFTQIHLDATMYPDCDMFHDGRGFVVGHLYLEAYFEQSLQAVDPRVAMHYLDYGKLFSSDQFESHLKHSMDGGAYTELFSDKWFGASDSSTGFLRDSRWKDFEIPLMTSKLLEDNSIPSTLFWHSDLWNDVYPEGWGNHGISPLGYQRGMWSVQSNNKLMRFHQVFDISSLNDIVTDFSSYKGVSCSYLTEFASSYVIDQSFETMSQNIEYHAHGPAHFAFGGTGGARAIEGGHVLKNKFGWTDTDIGLLSWAAHHALKNSFNSLFTNDYNPNTSRLLAAKLPVNEEEFEYDWDKLNANDGAYVKSKGDYGGISFEPAFDRVAESAEAAGNSVEKEWLLSLLKISSGDATSIFTQVQYDKLTNDKLAAIIDVIVGNLQIEGDISTNGAPLDPVFWMLHGEVFRMLHRVYFEGALSDASFTTVSSCEGHSALGTNPWLLGYHFSHSGSSSSVNVTELTNRDLASYLDPMSFDFNDKFDFIYDAAEYGWCPEFNQALSNYTLSQKVETERTGLHRAEGEKKTAFGGM